jgi:hypothetical protein
MKRFLVAVLILALTGCGGTPTTQAPPDAPASKDRVEAPLPLPQALCPELRPDAPPPILEVSYNI